MLLFCRRGFFLTFKFIMMKLLIALCPFFLGFAKPQSICRTQDRIHEFYQEGQKVVFRTNDFMPFLDPANHVHLRVVFWKKSITAPFTIEKGEMRVDRLSFFAITNIRLKGEGRFLVAFSQSDNPCPVNYYFTLIPNQLPDAKKVKAEHNCK
jgi:hypothetical protein